MALLGVALGLSCSRLGHRGLEVDASSATYVRTDSDSTTVVSPRGRASFVADDALAVDLAYGMDAWSGASIDVRTAATAPIREIRQQLDGGITWRGDDWSVGGSYRFSTEPDYRSHGGTVRAAVELFQRNTTLALDLFGAGDTVGREGDPAFRRPVNAVGGRVTYTQIIDRKTIGEISWESQRVGGFQSSPYRWVAIGGDGTCASLAPLCIPERHPDERWRHAANVRARRAFGKRLSLGAEYRYYFDSWGVQSHTLRPDIAFVPARRKFREDTLSFHYRYYTQGEARFYLPRYFELEGLAYATRDRKLSTMYSHTLGPSWTHRFDAGNTSIQPSFGFSASYSLLRYLAFVGLERVHAVELTATFGAAFR